MNFIKTFISSAWVRLTRLWQAAISFNHRAVRSVKISSVANAQALSDEIFFLMSIKIRTENRQGIMRETLRQCFSALSPETHIVFRINDSSDDHWHASNKELFAQLPAIEPLVRRSQVRLPGAYSQFLSEQQQPYVLTVFDDFPLFGLTDSFLQASIQLLKDFAGQVDAILIDDVGRYEVGDNGKNIIIHTGTMNYKIHGEKPLREVYYGEESFLIFSNYHFGFFFSAGIYPAKDHLRRLNWYVTHVSSDNPHKIELAGKLRRGPYYRYIAIPKRVFRLDMDFEHTEISIRPPVESSRVLYAALQSGAHHTIKP